MTNLFDVHIFKTDAILSYYYSANGREIYALQRSNYTRFNEKQETKTLQTGIRSAQFSNVLFNNLFYFLYENLNKII